MIVALRGKLAKSSPLGAVVDVNGVFYGVSIPLTTAERLPKIGAEVFLHTLAVYREDSHTLYGFATEGDRDFFAALVEKVSGIGPKIALNMLSRMSADSLKSAIMAGDVSLLSKCPGIGRKTAERLVLELRGAFGAPLRNFGAQVIHQPHDEKDDGDDDGDGQHAFPENIERFYYVVPTECGE